MQLWKRRATGPLGLVLFALGAAAGLAVPRDMLATSEGRSDEVQLTAGNDLDSHRVPLPPWPAPPIAASAAPAAPAAPVALSPRKIAERALEFTASVRGKGAYGAGVLIDERHVLTCLHVLAGLDRAEVRFTDGEGGPATVIDRDPALDLALLKLSRPRAGGAARPASIVDTFAGDEVFAMGTPRKMSFSLSRGIVSYVGRGFDDVFYVQTDLALNGGSSGGPLLNERGELIGISSFILRDSQGLAFALPIDYALTRFAEALGTRADDKAFQGWLSQRGPSIAIK